MDKKHHRLDDLFRQGLSDLELSPTDAGRSDFLQKADRELKKRSIRTWWLPGIGIILGILMISGVFLFLSSTKIKLDRKTSSGKITTVQPFQSVPHKSMTTIQIQDVHMLTTKKSSTGKNILSSHKISKSKAGSFTHHTSEPTFLTKKEKDEQHATAFISSPVSIPPVTSQPEQNKPSLTSNTTITDSIKLAIPEASSENSRLSNDSINSTPFTPLKKDTIRPHPGTIYYQDKKICIGFYYTPEWIFNTLDSNKYVNNFGVEATFHFGHYSIRTGVGLSITRGFNEIAIETKPYLGGYNELDHITYQWDSKHYHLIPTYFTNWREVFDTALDNNYYFREKQYTYLQIPLILGYDFLNKKWFSIGARVGPILSVLVKSRELSSSYDAGKDLIVTINNVTPDRIHLNWQAMAGINAGFRISRIFVFEVEPNIRYYFDSVYEKSGPSDKPWSVGFRTALLVNF